MKKPLCILSFFFLLVVSLTACTSAKVLKADAKYLRPWHKDANSLEPFAYPFVIKYQKGKKELIFVALEHVTGTNNSTSKTIRWAFDQNPQAVVIEGFANNLGESPSHFKNASQNCAKKNFDGCGEPYLSMYLAQKNSIPFFGGEPDDLKIASALNEKGYSNKDLLGFMVLRMVPQWRQEGKIDKTGFKNEALKMLRTYSKKLQIDPPMTLNELYLWYMEKSGAASMPIDIIEENTAPYEGNDASYFQKLSLNISMYRDQFIVHFVTELLGEFDRVVVAYGGSHHFVQQPVYEKMLGKPIFLKPF